MPNKPWYEKGDFASCIMYYIENALWVPFSILQMCDYQLHVVIMKKYYAYYVVLWFLQGEIGNVMRCL